MQHPPITRILQDLRGGDDRAVELLLPLLYEELRRIAKGVMRRERADHTLQPTALVHEAYVRMVGSVEVEWEDRAHFLGIAARVMRQVLIDASRRRHAARRGGAGARITLSEGGLGVADDAPDLLDVHRALERFAEVDARAAKVAELRLFAGATVPEAAEVLGVSRRTVDMDWATARLWLARELAS